MTGSLVAAHDRTRKIAAKWTYSLMDGGLFVEVGAGPGRKDGPKLAHVRLGLALLALCRLERIAKPR